MRIKTFVFVFFAYLGVQAQNVVQIGISGASNQVRVVNLNENGLIVLDKSSSGLLRIKKLDNDLALLWDVDVDIATKDNFLDEYYDGKFLYLLLEQKNSTIYHVLKISTSFAAVQKIDIKTVAGFQMSNFLASDEGICLGGSVKNEPFLIFSEQYSSTPKYYSSNLKGETLIQSMNLKDQGIVITYLNKYKKKTQLLYREYNFAGKISKSTPIPPADGYQFLTAKFFESKNKKLVVGNYGFAKNSNSDNQQSSQGIYVADLDHLNEIKYYSFDKFDKFFDFLNDKQKERLDKQVKKKKAKGSEYNFDYRLHINELISEGENILIATEVFMPEFRSNSLNSPFIGSPYGLSSYYSPYMWGRQFYNNYYWMNSPSMWGYRNRNSSTFDGFKYIEGVLIAIKPNGDLVWDNSVQYKNLKYYQLKPHMRISNTGQNTFLFYSNQDKLNLKEYNSEGKEIKGEIFDKSNPIIIQKSRKAEFENFEHWFGDYFYNWGVIKNAESNFKQTLFIQKIPVK